MFGIDASEFLVIAIVAIVVIGPKDLPLALRTAGKWVAQMRKVSGHFRAGFDAMVREAEMEELERKWAEQNAKIMREHPEGVDEAERTGAYPAPVDQEVAAVDQAGTLPPPAMEPLPPRQVPTVTQPSDQSASERGQ